MRSSRASSAPERVERRKVIGLPRVVLSHDRSSGVHQYIRIRAKRLLSTVARRSVLDDPQIIRRQQRIEHEAGLLDILAGAFEAVNDGHGAMDGFLTGSIANDIPAVLPRDAKAVAGT